MIEAVSIAIATPSCRDPKWGYKNSLEQMMFRMQMSREGSLHHMGGKSIKSFELLGRTQASLLSQGRQKIYDLAIAEGFDYLLWWDDDVALESPEALSMLFAANAPSIACNVLCKGVSPYPEKYPDDGIWFSAIGLDGNPMSSLRATGTEECYSCGMALHLIDLRAVKHIPRPHFEVRWDTGWNDYRGEDWYFTRKLAEHNIRTLIHHDASRLCSHIGDWEYNVKNMAIFMKSAKAFAKIAEMMAAEKK